MKVKLWMVFEAIGPDRESVENSLNDHIEKLDSEGKIKVVESEIDEVSEVEDPHPSLEKGFSQVAEIRVEADNYAKAQEVVINYGPTYVQMEGPDKYELSLSESQQALQNLANTMHQYAQMGAGGVLISSADSEAEE